MIRRLAVSAAAFVVLMLQPAAASAQCPTAVNLTASSQGCDVRLSWQNAPGAPSPLAWAVYRRDAGSGPSFTLLSNTLPGNTIFTDTTTVPPAGYIYFVRAIVNTGPCATANLDSDQVTGSTSLIPKLTVPASTCDGVFLRWFEFPGATSYVIKRRVVGNSAVTDIATLPPGVITYMDTAALPNVAYEYRLVSVTPCGSLGQSQYLSGSRALPPTAGVVPESVVRQAGESVTITFDIDTPSSPFPQSTGILHDGVPIVSDARRTISADGASLTIANVREQDIGAYTYSVSNTCGTVTQRVVLAVRPSPCGADFNKSGGVSVQDVFDFLAAFFAGCP